MKTLIITLFNIILFSFVTISEVLGQNQLVKTLLINDGTDNVKTYNSDAIIDMISASKGLLLPRVTLTSTSSASPLSTHVTGISIYNTNTSGNGNTSVNQGIFYNDGTKWQGLFKLPANGISEQFLVSDGNNGAKWGNKQIDGTIISPSYDITVKRLDMGSQYKKFAHADLAVGKYMISYSLFFGMKSVTGNQPSGFCTLNKDPENAVYADIIGALVTGSYSCTSVGTESMPVHQWTNASFILELSEASTIYIGVCETLGSFGYFLDGADYAGNNAPQYDSYVQIVKIL